MAPKSMKTHIAEAAGFLAALDQSGGSTPGALRLYGVRDTAYSGEAEMFARMHEMRVRVMTAPAFTGDKVIGAILFERTMDGMAGGKPVPQALIERGIIPFIKIDKGLEAEADGVQLMKPMPELDALLARSKALGVYGTKERSVINSAHREGIAAVVDQQFEIGRQVLSHGMMPIIEPEVNIKSATRGECDEILVEEIFRNLGQLPRGEQVMLKLSLPVKPGRFDGLVDHPKVLRVVALSGGYNRPEACAELAKNRGVVASFSRALLEDLRAQMSDAEFDASLGAAIDAIYQGSTQKTGAAVGA
jgi:fructose-bisphosphate aldolase class I